jgi:hypothetical protein
VLVEVRIHVQGGSTGSEGGKRPFKMVKSSESGLSRRRLPHVVGESEVWVVSVTGEGCVGVGVRRVAGGEDRDVSGEERL